RLVPARTGKRAMPAVNKAIPLWTRLGNAVHRRHVDAVRTSGADEQPADRHPLPDEGIEAAQHELQRRRTGAERPGGVLRKRARALDALRDGGARQDPIAAIAGKAADHADE